MGNKMIALIHNDSMFHMPTCSIVFCYVYPAECSRYSLERSRLPQADVDWRNRPGSVLTTLKAVGKVAAVQVEVDDGRQPKRPPRLPVHPVCRRTCLYIVCLLVASLYASSWPRRSAWLRLILRRGKRHLFHTLSMASTPMISHYLNGLHYSHPTVTADQMSVVVSPCGKQQWKTSV